MSRINSLINLQALVALAVTTASGEYRFTVPPDYPNRIVLSLDYPAGELPQDDDIAIDAFYANDPNEPDGLYHPCGGIDYSVPRMEFEPGAHYLIRKKESIHAFGARLTGFTSETTVET